MKSGYSVRISLPRDVQRHLGIRAGEFIRFDVVEGGRVMIRKLNLQEVQHAHTQGSRS
jgi:bifunctional DNA-binding transcriptional regulator/antitoxin component of YhaV-PrlF toxin-antitoxin module